jgi:hypothetical protein
MDTATFNMLNITASEDLGNGMSAFAKYNMLTKAGTSIDETNGDMVVGISGGFGTIVAQSLALRKDVDKKVCPVGSKDYCSLLLTLSVSI